MKSVFELTQYIIVGVGWGAMPKDLGASSSWHDMSLFLPVTYGARVK